MRPSRTCPRRSTSINGSLLHKSIWPPPPFRVKDGEWGECWIDEEDATVESWRNNGKAKNMAKLQCEQSGLNFQLCRAALVPQDPHRHPPGVAAAGPLPFVPGPGPPDAQLRGGQTQVLRRHGQVCGGEEEV
eukprot:scaffold43030_cov23-Tisochrysis_lutea.AAC.3